MLHLPPDRYPELRPEERFRYQRLEEDTSDWRAEGEWRVEGDFDFRDASTDDVTVLMWRADWRATIDAPFRSVLLSDEWPSHENE